MGESKALSDFGHVDLDLEAESDLVLQDFAAFPFGHVELDVPPPEDATCPPSTSRVFNQRSRDASAAGSAVAGIVAVDAHGRVREAVEGAAGSAFGRSDPASYGSGSRPPNDRVAEMRDLYALGDVAGALAVAATIGHDGDEALPASGDHPDASIVVEFAEESIELVDPFGGLIVDDTDLSATISVPPPPVAAASLTLTQRQSIPRLVKSMGELSTLAIDHRSAFLLAHIDGRNTLDELLDVCAMPVYEALGLMADLQTMGVIEFE